MRKQMLLHVLLPLLLGGSIYLAARPTALAFVNDAPFLWTIIAFSASILVEIGQHFHIISGIYDWDQLGFQVAGIDFYVRGGVAAKSR